MSTLKKGDRVLVTGGTGLIGTNLVNTLRKQGYETFASSSKHDLRDLSQAKALFEEFKPTVVFHMAARVGGIYANSTYKAGFYSDNVLINTHVINCCVESGIEYVFAMGTGCAYPKRLEGQTLFEKDFLDGIPEETNDAYAYAKRGMLVHLQALKEVDAINYTYCLPANIYGPHDNFHPMHSHVAPALVRRFYEAEKDKALSVAVWGDGSAARDFLYIDDCVSAMLLLAETGYTGTVNVGTGKLSTIRTLAEIIAEELDYQGEIIWDTSYPSGQAERTMNRSIMDSLGWKEEVLLKEGVAKTLQWYDENVGNVSER